MKETTNDKNIVAKFLKR